jgi:Flp pilus assembly protein TadG
MPVVSLIHRLCRHARNLRRAEDGNVAIIFTIALLPIIGLAGGAIDYSRASATKTAMQAALDATALAMSKDASSLTQSQLSQKAEAYFKAAFNRPEAKNLNITTSYSSADGASVTITSSADVATNFLGVMGIDKIPVGSYAKTAWGNGKLRVALVLDNSGSMGSGGRLTALKTATKNLLTQLEAAASKPGDVQAAIVPFNKNVNVGSGNATAPWVDWTEWDDVNGECSKSSYSTKSKCLSKGKTWTAKNHNDWNGCVTDRDQPQDVDNATPDVSKSATLLPADQASSCPSVIKTMGYDWSSLKTKVDGMIADGYTNQPIGLAWGWHALSQGAPLSSPPITDAKNTQSVIILLSDGENTQNRWSTSESKINARQKLICDNIKAAGVKIYSVLLIDGNESLMKDCASEPAMFFKLTSASQVVSAFEAIGTKLSKLRLAQ